MAVEVDTFLTAVYTLVDTLYQRHLAPHKPARRGRRPEVSDSEVLTLLLLGQWLGTSERALLRHADAYWRAWFPRQLSQSAFNRRVGDLGAALTRLVPVLAAELGAGAAPYEIVDTTPVPLMRQCRGRHHRLFADAAVGRGGSDHGFFYGCSLLLAVSTDGAITGFVVGAANTEGRWLLDALLTWRVTPAGVPLGPADLPPSHAKGGTRVGPTGPRWWPDSAGAMAAGPYLADAGFTGAVWQTHWQHDTGAVVLTPAAFAAGRARGAARQWRQRVEVVNGVLAGALHLPYPGARTMWGLVTRIAAKCAALNVGIWVNRLLGRPDLAIRTLFPA